ncbi:cytosolic sulfotransferase 13-like [Daucus carota subsp. sativus]|uniref:cytosolic sulfotransferase 13-like n=1 Tax=Daucus carota subsp. sativus TaxID=79200 RepID=UPI003082FEB8
MHNISHAFAPLLHTQHIMEAKTTESDAETVVYSQEWVSSLPKDKGIVGDYTYQYQGYWHTPLGLQGMIDCQQHFRPRENDVFLVTAPKSGTTWMKAILYAIVHRQKHHPQDAQHPLRQKTPHQLVPFFEITKPSEYESLFLDGTCRIFGCHFPIGFEELEDAVKVDEILADKKSLSYLVAFYQTIEANLMWASSSWACGPTSITEEDGGSTNIKIVYLCRDIKDSFVSLFHFSNKANLRSSPVSLEEAFHLFCKGTSTGGPIWDQILGYWKESLERPNKVLFMRYEELKSEPHAQVTRLAQFLGRPFSPEEENMEMVDQITSLCSFGNMSKTAG